MVVELIFIVCVGTCPDIGCPAEVCGPAANNPDDAIEFAAGTLPELVLIAAKKNVVVVVPAGTVVTLAHTSQSPAVNAMETRLVADPELKLPLVVHDVENVSPTTPAAALEALVNPVITGVVNAIEVLVQEDILPDEGVPMLGVTSVGEVANTRLPDPVIPDAFGPYE